MKREIIRRNLGRWNQDSLRFHRDVLVRPVGLILNQVLSKPLILHEYCTAQAGRGSRLLCLLKLPAALQALRTFGHLSYFLGAWPLNFSKAHYRTVYRRLLLRRDAEDKHFKSVVELLRPRLQYWHLKNASQSSARPTSRKTSICQILKEDSSRLFLENLARTLKLREPPNLPRGELPEPRPTDFVKRNRSKGSPAQYGSVGSKPFVSKKPSVLGPRALASREHSPPEPPRPARALNPSFKSKKSVVNSAEESRPKDSTLSVRTGQSDRHDPYHLNSIVHRQDNLKSLKVSMQKTKETNSQRQSKPEPGRPLVAARKDIRLLLELAQPKAAPLTAKFSAVASLLLSRQSRQLGQKKSGEGFKPVASCVLGRARPDAPAPGPSRQRLKKKSADRLSESLSLRNPLALSTKIRARKL